MGTASDVEKQAMRRIERHQRREAIAPVGYIVQQFGIGGFVGVEYLDLRTDRASIGKRQADLEAETGRGIIQRGDLQRIALFGDDDHGGGFVPSPLVGSEASRARSRGQGG